MGEKREDGREKRGWERKERMGEKREDGREKRGRLDNLMHGRAGSLCCRYSVTDGGGRPCPPLTASQLQH